MMAVVFDLFVIVSFFLFAGLLARGMEKVETRLEKWQDPNSSDE
jgi:hypothetical protein